MDKILNLLNPYKWYLRAALALMLVVAVWTVDNWRHQATLYEQEVKNHAADNTKCESDKLLTKGANDALQQNRDTINRELARLKRVRPQRCVPVLTSTPLNFPGGTEHAGPDGINSDTLRDYAAVCEGYRSTVIVVDKFLDEERK